MEPIATWAKLLLGVLVLLVILWLSPGIKKMMAVSRDAKSDWIGLIMPIAMGMINPIQSLFASRLTAIIFLIPGDNHRITSRTSTPNSSFAQVAIGSIFFWSFGQRP